MNGNQTYTDWLRRLYDDFLRRLQSGDSAPELQFLSIAELASLGLEAKRRYYDQLNKPVDIEAVRKEYAQSPAAILSDLDSVAGDEESIVERMLRNRWKVRYAGIVPDVLQEVFSRHPDLQRRVWELDNLPEEQRVVEWQKILDEANNRLRSDSELQYAVDQRFEGQFEQSGLKERAAQWARDIANYTRLLRQKRYHEATAAYRNLVGRINREVKETLQSGANDPASLAWAQTLYEHVRPLLGGLKVATSHYTESPREGLVIDRPVVFNHYVPAAVRLYGQLRDVVRREGIAFLKDFDELIRQGLLHVVRNPNDGNWYLVPGYYDGSQFHFGTLALGQVLPIRDARRGNVVNMFVTPEAVARMEQAARDDLPKVRGETFGLQFPAAYWGVGLTGNKAASWTVQATPDELSKKRDLAFSPHLGHTIATVLHNVANFFGFADALSRRDRSIPNLTETSPTANVLQTMLDLALILAGGAGSMKVGARLATALGRPLSRPLIMGLAATYGGLSNSLMWWRDMLNMGVADPEKVLAMAAGAVLTGAVGGALGAAGGAAIARSGARLATGLARSVPREIARVAGTVAGVAAADVATGSAELWWMSRLLDLPEDQREKTILENLPMLLAMSLVGSSLDIRDAVRLYREISAVRSIAPQTFQAILKARDVQQGGATAVAELLANLIQGYAAYQAQPQAAPPSVAVPQTIAQLVPSQATPHPIEAELTSLIQNRPQDVSKAVAGLLSAYSLGEPASAQYLHGELVRQLQQAQFDQNKGAFVEALRQRIDELRKAGLPTPTDDELNQLQAQATPIDFSLHLNDLVKTYPHLFGLVGQVPTSVVSSAPSHLGATQAQPTSLLTAQQPTAPTQPSQSATRSVFDQLNEILKTYGSKQQAKPLTPDEIQKIGEVFQQAGPDIVKNYYDLQNPALQTALKAFPQHIRTLLKAGLSQQAQTHQQIQSGVKQVAGTIEEHILTPALTELAQMPIQDIPVEVAQKINQKDFAGLLDDLLTAHLKRGELDVVGNYFVTIAQYLKAQSPLDAQNAVGDLLKQVIDSYKRLYPGSTSWPPAQGIQSTEVRAVLEGAGKILAPHSFLELMEKVYAGGDGHAAVELYQRLSDKYESWAKQADKDVHVELQELSQNRAKVDEVLKALRDPQILGGKPSWSSEAIEQALKQNDVSAANAIQVFRESEFKDANQFINRLLDAQFPRHEWQEDKDRTALSNILREFHNHWEELANLVYKNVLQKNQDLDAKLRGLVASEKMTEAEWKNPVEFAQTFLRTLAAIPDDKQKAKFFGSVMDHLARISLSDQDTARKWGHDVIVEVIDNLTKHPGQYIPAIQKAASDQNVWGPATYSDVLRFALELWSLATQVSLNNPSLRRALASYPQSFGAFLGNVAKFLQSVDDYFSKYTVAIQSGGDWAIAAGRELQGELAKLFPQSIWNELVAPAKKPDLTRILENLLTAGRIHARLPSLQQAPTTLAESLTTRAEALANFWSASHYLADTLEEIKEIESGSKSITGIDRAKIERYDSFVTSLGTLLELSGLSLDDRVKQVGTIPKNIHLAAIEHRRAFATVLHELAKLAVEESDRHPGIQTRLASRVLPAFQQVAGKPIRTIYDLWGPNGTKLYNTYLAALHWLQSDSRGVSNWEQIVVWHFGIPDSQVKEGAQLATVLEKLAESILTGVVGRGNVNDKDVVRLASQFLKEALAAALGDPHTASRDFFAFAEQRYRELVRAHKDVLFAIDDVLQAFDDVAELQRSGDIEDSVTISDSTPSQGVDVSTDHQAQLRAIIAAKEALSFLLPDKNPARQRIEGIHKDTIADYNAAKRFRRKRRQEFMKSLGDSISALLQAAHQQYINTRASNDLEQFAALVESIGLAVKDAEHGILTRTEIDSKGQQQVIEISISDSVELAKQAIAAHSALSRDALGKNRRYAPQSALKRGMEDIGEGQSKAAREVRAKWETEAEKFHQKIVDKVTQTPGQDVALWTDELMEALHVVMGGDANVLTSSDEIKKQIENFQLAKLRLEKVLKEIRQLSKEKQQVIEREVVSRVREAKQVSIFEPKLEAVIDTVKKSAERRLKRLLQMYRDAVVRDHFIAVEKELRSSPQAIQLGAALYGKTSGVRLSALPTVLEDWARVVVERAVQNDVLAQLVARDITPQSAPQTTRTYLVQLPFDVYANTLQHGIARYIATLHVTYDTKSQSITRTAISGVYRQLGGNRFERVTHHDVIREHYDSDINYMAHMHQPGIESILSRIVAFEGYTGFTEPLETVNLRLRIDPNQGPSDVQFTTSSKQQITVQYVLVPVDEAKKIYHAVILGELSGGQLQPIVVDTWRESDWANLRAAIATQVYNQHLQNIWITRVTYRSTSFDIPDSITWLSLLRSGQYPPQFNKIVGEGLVKSGAYVEQFYPIVFRGRERQFFLRIREGADTHDFVISAQDFLSTVRDVANIRSQSRSLVRRLNDLADDLNSHVHAVSSLIKEVGNDLLAIARAKKLRTDMNSIWSWFLQGLFSHQMTSSFPYTGVLSSPQNLNEAKWRLRQARSVLKATVDFVEDYMSQLRKTLANLKPGNSSTIVKAFEDFHQSLGDLLSFSQQFSSKLRDRLRRFQGSLVLAGTRIQDVVKAVKALHPQAIQDIEQLRQKFTASSQIDATDLDIYRKNVVQILDAIRAEYETLVTTYDSVLPHIEEVLGAIWRAYHLVDKELVEHIYKLNQSNQIVISSFRAWKALFDFMKFADSIKTLPIVTDLQQEITADRTSAIIARELWDYSSRISLSPGEIGIPLRRDGVPAAPIVEFQHQNQRYQGVISRVYGATYWHVDLSNPALPQIRFYDHQYNPISTSQVDVEVTYWTPTGMASLRINGSNIVKLLHVSRGGISSPLAVLGGRLVPFRPVPIPVNAVVAKPTGELALRIFVRSQDGTIYAVDPVTYSLEMTRAIKERARREAIEELKRVRQATLKTEMTQEETEALEQQINTALEKYEEAVKAKLKKQSTKEKLGTTQLHLAQLVRGIARRMARDYETILDVASSVDWRAAGGEVVDGFVASRSLISLPVTAGYQSVEELFAAHSLTSMLSEKGIRATRLKWLMELLARGRIEFNVSPFNEKEFGIFNRFLNALGVDRANRESTFLRVSQEVDFVDGKLVNKYIVEPKPPFWELLSGQGVIGALTESVDRFLGSGEDENKEVIAALQKVLDLSVGVATRTDDRHAALLAAIQRRRSRYFTLLRQEALLNLNTALQKMEALLDPNGLLAKHYEQPDDPDIYEQLIQYISSIEQLVGVQIAFPLVGENIFVAPAQPDERFLVLTRTFFDIRSYLEELRDKIYKSLVDEDTLLEIAGGMYRMAAHPEFEDEADWTDLEEAIGGEVPEELQTWEGVVDVVMQSIWGPRYRIEEVTIGPVYTVPSYTAFTLSSATTAIRDWKSITDRIVRDYTAVEQSYIVKQQSLKKKRAGVHYSQPSREVQQSVQKLREQQNALKEQFNELLSTTKNGILGTFERGHEFIEKTARTGKSKSIGEQMTSLLQVFLYPVHQIQVIPDEETDWDSVVRLNPHLVLLHALFDPRVANGELPLEQAMKEVTLALKSKVVELGKEAVKIVNDFAKATPTGQVATSVPASIKDQVDRWFKSLQELTEKYIFKFLDTASREYEATGLDFQHFADFLKNKMKEAAQEEGGLVRLIQGMFDLRKSNTSSAFRVLAYAALARSMRKLAETFSRVFKFDSSTITTGELIQQVLVPWLKLFVPQVQAAQFEELKTLFGFPVELNLSDIAQRIERLRDESFFIEGRMTSFLLNAADIATDERLLTVAASNYVLGSMLKALPSLTTYFIEGLARSVKQSARQPGHPQIDQKKIQEAINNVKLLKDALRQILSPIAPYKVDVSPPSDEELAKAARSAVYFLAEYVARLIHPSGNQESQRAVTAQTISSILTQPGYFQQVLEDVRNDHLALIAEILSSDASGLLAKDSFAGQGFDAERGIHVREVPNSIIAGSIWFKTTPAETNEAVAQNVVEAVKYRFPGALPQEVESSLKKEIEKIVSKLEQEQTLLANDHILVELIPEKTKDDQPSARIILYPLSIDSQEGKYVVKVGRVLDLGRTPLVPNSWRTRKVSALGAKIFQSKVSTAAFGVLLKDVNELGGSKRHTILAFTGLKAEHPLIMPGPGNQATSTVTLVNRALRERDPRVVSLKTPEATEAINRALAIEAVPKHEAIKKAAEALDQQIQLINPVDTIVKSILSDIAQTTRQIADTIKIGGDATGLLQHAVVQMVTLREIAPERESELIKLAEQSEAGAGTFYSMLVRLGHSLQVAYPMFGGTSLESQDSAARVVSALLAGTYKRLIKEAYPGFKIRADALGLLALGAWELFSDDEEKDRWTPYILLGAVAAPGLFRLGTFGRLWKSLRRPFAALGGKLAYAAPPLPTVTRYGAHPLVVKFNEFWEDVSKLAGRPLPIGASKEALYQAYVALATKLSEGVPQWSLLRFFMRPAQEALSNPMAQMMHESANGQALAVRRLLRQAQEAVERLSPVERQIAGIVLTALDYIASTPLASVNDPVRDLALALQRVRGHLSSDIVVRILKSLVDPQNAKYVDARVRKAINSMFRSLGEDGTVRTVMGWVDTVHTAVLQSRLLEEAMREASVRGLDGTSVYLAAIRGYEWAKQVYQGAQAISGDILKQLEIVGEMYAQELMRLIDSLSNPQQAQSAAPGILAQFIGALPQTVFGELYSTLTQAQQFAHLVGFRLGVGQFFKTTEYYTPRAYWLDPPGEHGYVAVPDVLYTSQQPLSDLEKLPVNLRSGIRVYGETPEKAYSNLRDALTAHGFTLAGVGDHGETWVLTRNGITYRYVVRPFRRSEIFQDSAATRSVESVLKVLRDAASVRGEAALRQAVLDNLKALSDNIQQIAQKAPALYPEIYEALDVIRFYTSTLSQPVPQAASNPQMEARLRDLLIQLKEFGDLLDSLEKNAGVDVLHHFGSFVTALTNLARYALGPQLGSARVRRSNNPGYLHGTYIDPETGNIVFHTADGYQRAVSMPYDYLQLAYRLAPNKALIAGARYAHLQLSSWLKALKLADFSAVREHQEHARSITLGSYLDDLLTAYVHGYYKPTKIGKLTGTAISTLLLGFSLGSFLKNLFVDLPVQLSAVTPLAKPSGTRASSLVRSTLSALPKVASPGWNVGLSEGARAIFEAARISVAIQPRIDAVMRILYDNLSSRESMGERLTKASLILLRLADERSRAAAGAFFSELLAQAMRPRFVGNEVEFTHPTLGVRLRWPRAEWENYAAQEVEKRVTATFGAFTRGDLSPIDQWVMRSGTVGDILSLMMRPQLPILSLGLRSIAALWHTVNNPKSIKALKTYGGSILAGTLIAMLFGGARAAPVFGQFLGFLEAIQNLLTEESEEEYESMARTNQSIWSFVRNTLRVPADVADLITKAVHTGLAGAVFNINLTRVNAVTGLGDIFAIKFFGDLANAIKRNQLERIARYVYIYRVLDDLNVWGDLPEYYAKQPVAQRLAQAFAGDPMRVYMLKPSLRYSFMPEQRVWGAHKLLREVLTNVEPTQEVITVLAERVIPTVAMRIPYYEKRLRQFREVYEAGLDRLLESNPGVWQTIAEVVGTAQFPTRESYREVLKQQLTPRWKDIAEILATLDALDDPKVRETLNAHRRSGEAGGGTPISNLLLKLAIALAGDQAELARDVQRLRAYGRLGSQQAGYSLLVRHLSDSRRAASIILAIESMEYARSLGARYGHDPRLIRAIRSVLRTALADLDLSLEDVLE